MINTFQTIIFRQCPFLEGIKNLMRSATSSEGPRLVRIAVPCAQTSVAIDIGGFRGVSEVSGNPLPAGYSITSYMCMCLHSLARQLRRLKLAFSAIDSAPEGSRTSQEC